MKTKKFFYLLLSLVAISFASCGGGDDDVDLTPTGISLNQASLSVEVAATQTLVATLAPTGSTGNIQWSSSDKSVAVVNGGIVTGIKEGTATIAATVSTYTATCIVTVKKAPVTLNHASLKGSDYFVLIMDGTTFPNIESKVAADYRPDDVNKNLYIWDGTFVANTTTSGRSFYGLNESWTSLKVGAIGWSGAGFNVKGGVDMTRITNNIDDYYFHVALKTDQIGKSFCFVLYDGPGAGVEARVAIGGPFVDGPITTPSFAALPADGEWHEFEVPMKYFQNQGLYYRTPKSDMNIVGLLGGGVQGTIVNLDAMFIYKKAK